MARTVFFGVLLICVAIFPMFSQGAPKGINYQACARNNIGEELKNHNIDVRISIYSEDPSTGKTEWVESHHTITNNYGIFSIIIGQGSQEGGMRENFGDIAWGSAPHFMKVEIDFGDGYRNMGINQFVSVPYALYAEYAGHFGTGDSITGIGIQTLSLNNNNELSISQGNTVTINVQDLRMSHDSLYLTRNPEGTKIDLSKYKDNTDAQTLSYQNGILQIANGNSVDVRTELIGFTAQKTTNSVISDTPDTLLLQFDELKEYTVNEGENNYEAGVFTVPSGYAGLYNFTIGYNFDDQQMLDLKIVSNIGVVSFMPIAGRSSNGSLIGYNTSSLMVYLNDGDKISVRLIADGLSYNGRGYFSGFKIR